jgi:hypothetical protein
MLTWMRALMVPALLLGLAACDRQGPAERTGERLDRTGERLRDTVDPPQGPAERLGRSLDRSMN